MNTIQIIKKILSLRYISQIRKNNFEKSLVIYLKDNSFLSKRNTEINGTNNNVQIGSIDNIINNCIELNTNEIVLIHTHPLVKNRNFLENLFLEANPNPSEEDIKITKHYQKILSKNNIKIVDHIILTESDYFSFSQNNLLK